MTVQPIRNKERIRDLIRYLEGTDDKYSLLFQFGIYSGLRVSDIIPLRVKDVFHESLRLREYLTLKEKKTKKNKQIKINENLKKVLLQYIKKHNLPYDSLLFRSNKGGHIGRVQAYRVLNKAAKRLQIDNFGTHTMRKTFGYWMYREHGKNIGLLMDIFNHSSEKTTLRYIGVMQDEKDNSYTSLRF